METMIRLDNHKKTAAAVERCRRLHPKVTCAGGDTFRVSASNGQGAYLVKIVKVRGMTLAACTCRRRWAFVLSRGRSCSSGLDDREPGQAPNEALDAGRSEQRALRASHDQG